MNTNQNWIPPKRVFWSQSLADCVLKGITKSTLTEIFYGISPYTMPLRLANVFQYGYYEPISQQLRLIDLLLASIENMQ